MVHSEEFIERLQVLLQHYKLSASAFADRIGVQRSNISHLLSGRNKPSLEFVLKLVQTFPEVDLYWLLKGEGSFPKTRELSPSPGHDRQEPLEPPVRESGIHSEAIEKIVFFYKDGSFKVYREN